MSNRVKGTLCILMAPSAFALMCTFVRLSGDVPSMQKAFFRNVVAAVFALLIMLRNHEPFHPPKKSHWGYLMARAVFGTMGLLCNFYAVDHLNLSDASMLNKMSPFFAILISYFLLNEKLNLVQGVSVIAAFLGCLLIIKPNPANMALVPSLIGLLGGFGAGVAYSFVRLMSKKGVHSTLIVFGVLYVLLSGVPALFHFGACAHDHVPVHLSAGCRNLRLHRSVCHHQRLSLRPRQGNFGL